MSYKIKVGVLPTGILAFFHHAGITMNSDYLFAGLFLTRPQVPGEQYLCLEYA